MLLAYHSAPTGLTRAAADIPLVNAVWIDLYRPMPPQIADLSSLGITVPSLADMEEIELSSRLYRLPGAEYITVVLTGLSVAKEPTSGPVCFILTPQRLITVRHHAPRPFETYPDRAPRNGPGCDRPEAIIPGLIEEIIGRIADILETIGTGLDEVTRQVYQGGASVLEASQLQRALERVGREGDLLGRVRLGLLTVERAVSFHLQGGADPTTPNSDAPRRAANDPRRSATKALLRDLQSLEVHADFLASRRALTSDATPGVINLSQNVTVRIVSVVAALFLPPTLPPTLIASIYGMNFAHMPELALAYGNPLAMVLMLGSAVGTYLFFKWKRWL